MKRFVSIAFLSVFCFVIEADAQLTCFYAQVREYTVELRWCPPQTNFYGTYVQRRVRGENLFLPWSTGYPRYCSPQSGVCIAIDVVQFSAVWQYRVQLIDLDGTVSYTDPINVLVRGTTAVNEDIPLQFSLAQNYPNPFNPTTRISYTLPRRKHASLKVLDLIGREVATLIEGEQEPGEKSVDFDASGLASGVYFYRLKAGSFVATKKLIVAK